MLFGRQVGRAFSVSPRLGFLLIASFGLVLSATLSPGGPGSIGSGACDLTRTGLPSWNELVRPGEILLNTLLFVPFGSVVGFLPPRSPRLAAVLAAYGSPVVIEAVQLIAVPLGRQCQSGDVIDNILGLSVGLLVGSAARWLVIRSDASVGSPGRDRDAPNTTPFLGLAAIFLVAATGTNPSVSTPPPSTIATPTTGTPERSSSSAPQPSANMSPSSVVRVSSVPALLEALADDAVDEIVVENGTYRVSPAGAQRANSLWIGSRFAGRTRPVLVRAGTPGGVTFDGGGMTGFVGIWFSNGAHHQTWDGFAFANGTPTSTGVIFFGERGEAPHDITLRRTTVTRTITTSSTGATDHAVYFSTNAYNLLIDGISVDGRGGLDTAFHFFHGPTNVTDVTIRNAEITGTDQAIMLWESSTKRVLFENVRITGATKYGVSFEAGSQITFRSVVSTDSGVRGFHSSLGPEPSGLTLINTSFH